MTIRGAASYLADGTHWEACPTIFHLRKFNFLFEFKDPLKDEDRTIDLIFNSFSTPFWQKLKKWYVAVTTHNVYTISCFNDQLIMSPTLTIFSTSPDNYWYYSKVKRIKIDDNILPINLNLFYNIEKLDITEENLLLSIDNINRFIHLRHLIFHQSVSNAILGNIIKNNPNIDHLTLSNSSFNHLTPLENVYYLNLQNSIKLTDRAHIKELCRIFPNIEQLYVHLHSRRLLCQLINSFHRLENGIFQFPKVIKPISDDWLKEHTRLLQDTCSFTYRSESNRFLLWISNTVSMKIYCQ